MSEVHVEEHSSPIKTPGQLIGVIVGTFAVVIAIPVLVSQLVTLSARTDKNHPSMADEAVASRIKPVGEVSITDPNAPKVEKSGKEVVETICQACHASGALNAPKIGDNARWAGLIKQGLVTLAASAIKGKNQMPARGGNPDLSDTEIARAIAYMANQSGGSLKEPEAKAAKK
jgi:cytochrome c5